MARRSKLPHASLSTSSSIIFPGSEECPPLAYEPGPALADPRSAEGKQEIQAIKASICVLHEALAKSNSRRSFLQSFIEAVDFGGESYT